MRTPAKRTGILGAAALALLLANVVALTAKTDGDEPAALGSPTAPATGTASDPSRADGDGNGNADPSASPTRTTGGGGPSYTVPIPGAYVHTTTTKAEITSSIGGTQRQDEEGQTRYTYARPRRDGGVTVQAVRIRVSGQSGDTTRTNEWRPRGLYRIRERSESRSCIYEPPWLLVRFPVRIGDSWTVEDRGCRGERPREGSSSTSRTTVMREETVEVGGVDVECVVIEEVTETTIDNDELKAESTSTDTYWFAPVFGLYVRTESTAHSESESRSEGAPFTVTFDSETTSQLVGLQPS